MCASGPTRRRPVVVLKYIRRKADPSGAAQARGFLRPWTYAWLSRLPSSTLGLLTTGSLGELPQSDGERHSHIGRWLIPVVSHREGGQEQSGGRRVSIQEGLHKERCALGEATSQVPSSLAHHSGSSVGQTLAGPSRCPQGSGKAKARRSASPPPRARSSHEKARSVRGRPISGCERKWWR